jgi:hypothetical protein
VVGDYAADRLGVPQMTVGAENACRCALVAQAVPHLRNGSVVVLADDGQLVHIRSPLNERRSRAAVPKKGGAARKSAVYLGGCRAGIGWFIGRMGGLLEALGRPTSAAAFGSDANVCNGRLRWTHRDR